jgi:uncharacterized membrane protein YidH (DUF202 family)
LKLTPPAARPPAAGAGDDLSFDLLGTPPPAKAEEAPGESSRMITRRTMLTVHQSLGVGLLVLTASTCVVGQLNWSDRFAGPSTGRYELTHAILSFSTLGLFTATALASLLAPTPLEKVRQGLDRGTLHKIGMFTAAAGMVAQATLGIASVQREGYQDQRTLATAHLVVGYITLAAMLLGVSAMVF